MPFNSFGIKGYIKDATGAVKQITDRVYVSVNSSSDGTLNPTIIKEVQTAYVNTESGIKQIWPNAKVLQVGPEITTDATWAGGDFESIPGWSVPTGQLGTPLWIRTPFTWTRDYSSVLSGFFYNSSRKYKLKNSIRINCPGLGARFNSPIVNDNTTGEPYFIRKGTVAYISAMTINPGNAINAGELDPFNFIKNTTITGHRTHIQLQGPNQQLPRFPFYARSAGEALQPAQQYYPGLYSTKLDEFTVTGVVIPAGQPTSGTIQGTGFLEIATPGLFPQSYTHLVESPDSPNNKNLSTVPPQQNVSTKVTVFLYGKDDDAERTFGFSQNHPRSRLECRQNSPNNKILKNAKYMACWAVPSSADRPDEGSLTNTIINNTPETSLAYARVFGDAAYRQAWTGYKRCSDNQDAVYRELGMGYVPSDTTLPRPVGWFTNCNNQIGIVNNTEGMPRPISFSSTTTNFSSGNWSLGNCKNSTSWGGDNSGSIGWDVSSRLYISTNGELRRSASAVHQGIHSYDHTVWFNHHWHNDRSTQCALTIDTSCMQAPNNDPSILILTTAQLNARINGPADNKVYFVHPNATNTSAFTKIDDDAKNRWHYLFNGVNQDIDSITLPFFQTRMNQDNYFYMPANALRLLIEKVNPD